MALTRDDLRQIGLLLRPLATRAANAVARAVVQLVDDDTRLQLVQLGVLAGETIDGAEHHQPYGFSSVPLPGAEAVVAFPNGDRAHPLVVTVSDRRYRPTGGDPGDVTMYHHTGAKVTFSTEGDIISTPATGRTVKIGSSAAADGAIKGTSRNTAEQTALNAHLTFLDALEVYAAAIQAVADPTNVATPVLAAAIHGFQSAIGTFASAAAAAVSTKVKLE
jgi:phage baseplate assembly protein V